VTGCPEYGNEPSGSIKYGKLKSWENISFLKRDLLHAVIYLFYINVSSMNWLWPHVLPLTDETEFYNTWCTDPKTNQYINQTEFLDWQSCRIISSNFYLKNLLIYLFCEATSTFKHESSVLTHLALPSFPYIAGWFREVELFVHEVTFGPRQDSLSDMVWISDKLSETPTKILRFIISLSS
jgi:hypothetical protein